MYLLCIICIKKSINNEGGRHLEPPKWILEWGTMEYQKVQSTTMIDPEEKMLNSRQKSTEKKWRVKAPPSPSPGFPGPVLYVI